MFLSSYTNTSGSLGEREMLWEYEPQGSAFFHSFFEFSQNSIETLFLFLLETNATRKRGKLVNFDYQNVNSSLRQQRALVLCLHRVIQTRFLTNQRACFLRTVFKVKMFNKLRTLCVFLYFSGSFSIHLNDRTRNRTLPGPVVAVSYKKLDRY